jgi:hypothetical protein
VTRRSRWMVEGEHDIEARFAVDTLANLPLDVR